MAWVAASRWRLTAGVRRRAGKVGMNLLKIGDQPVNHRQKFIAAGMGTAADKFGRTAGQLLLPRLTRPAPNLTVSQQGKPAQVFALAGEPQVAKDVLKTNLK